MAIILRSGALKLISGLPGGLCKIPLKNNKSITQVAFITSKALRQDRPSRPPPFDYRNKKYGFWAMFTDPIAERFDDNTRIVVVEGLPGVGKTKFAQELAEELEMYYLPPQSWDEIYVDPHGFDYRSLNPKLPIDAKYFDLNDFLDDPTGRNSASIQVHYYLMRYSTYIDALAHLFSTGQGVVMERSPWSDICFAKAMYNCGYISRGAYNFYTSCLDVSLHRLFRPHLAIYLDASVDYIQAQIKKRGDPHEVNSKALSAKYFSELEHCYKELHLPDISKHAQLLVYNWEDKPPMSDVIDDIEDLQCDVEDFTREESKLADWRFASVEHQREARHEYVNRKDQLMYSCVPSRWDVPEMITSAQAVRKRLEVWEELYEEKPGKRYAWGFDTDNDKGLLWKTENRWDSSFRQPKKIETQQE